MNLLSERQYFAKDEAVHCIRMRNGTFALSHLLRWTTIVLLVFFSELGWCQFPSACPTADKQCCPSFEGAVCGGSARGTCTDVSIPETAVCEPRLLENLSWFTRNFTHACVCKNRFRGPACEKCAFGWSGRECNVRLPTKLRREFSSLSKNEQNYFISALLKAKTTPSSYTVAEASGPVSVYDFFTYVHHFSVKYNSSTDLAHAGPGFLTWHRTIALLLEEALGEIMGDSQFTIPYWDWTRADTLNTNTATILAAFGGDGKDDGTCHTFPLCNCSVASGPFKDWLIVEDDWAINASTSGRSPIQRAFGCDITAQTLPHRSAVDYLLRFPVYEAHPYIGESHVHSLRNYLEGFALTPNHSLPMPQARDVHNRVHIWIGGTMYKVEHAATDPLFWPHHVFVDMLFEKWARLQTDQCILVGGPELGAPVGHNFHECVGGVFPLVKHSDIFRTSLELGYTYEDLEKEREENEQRARGSAPSGSLADLWGVDPNTALAVTLCLSLLSGLIIGIFLGRTNICPLRCCKTSHAAKLDSTTTTRAASQVSKRSQGKYSLVDADPHDVNDASALAPKDKYSLGDIELENGASHDNVSTSHV